jgi:hypothetical protein
MKVLAVAAAGAMAGLAVVGGIWSLMSLRRLVWPQGILASNLGVAAARRDP